MIEENYTGNKQQRERTILNYSTTYTERDNCKLHKDMEAKGEKYKTSKRENNCKLHVHKSKCDAC